MELKVLQREFDRMQLFHGDRNLHAVYGCGKEQNPRLAIIFLGTNINNLSIRREWKGINAHEIGTKALWNLLWRSNLLDEKLNEKIKSKKPEEWDIEFCEEVYKM